MDIQNYYLDDYHRKNFDSMIYWMLENSTKAVLDIFKDGILKFKELNLDSHTFTDQIYGLKEEFDRTWDHCHLFPTRMYKIMFDVLLENTNVLFDYYEEKSFTNPKLWMRHTSN